MFKLFWALTAIILVTTSSGAVSAQISDIFATVRYYPSATLDEGSVSLSAGTDFLSIRSQASNSATLADAKTAKPSLPSPISTSSTTKILHQKDPRVKDLSIGWDTIGNSGCLALSVANVIIDYGYGSAAQEVLEKMISGNIFDSNGKLESSLIGTLFPGLQAREEPQAIRHKLAAKVRKYLEDGNSVLLEVHRGKRLHWIRALSIDGGDVKIADTANGQTGTFANIYGSRSVQKVMLIRKS